MQSYGRGEGTIIKGTDPSGNAISIYLPPGTTWAYDPRYPGWVWWIQSNGTIGWIYPTSPITRGNRPPYTGPQQFRPPDPFPGAGGMPLETPRPPTHWAPLPGLRGGGTGITGGLGSGREGGGNFWIIVPTPQFPGGSVIYTT